MCKELKIVSDTEYELCTILLLLLFLLVLVGRSPMTHCQRQRMIIVSTTELQTIICLSLSFSSPYACLQLNTRTRSQEMYILVLSSTNQICDFLYFKSPALNVLVVSNSVSSPLSLNQPFFPTLLFPQLSSFFLSPVPLSQSSVSFSQLSHIPSFTASLRPHHPSTLHLLWAEDTPRLYIWPQKSILPLFQDETHFLCHANRDFVQDE